MRPSLLLVAALSTVALSTSAIAGTPLWQNLEAGMSKAEVKSLLPNRRVQLTDVCAADVSPSFASGKLEGVDLETGSGSSSACGQVVEQTLLKKYGHPDRTQHQIEPHDCGSPYVTGFLRKMYNLCEASGGEHTDHYLLREWLTGLTQIVLKIDEADPSKWWLYYRPQAASSAEAAGKL